MQTKVQKWGNSIALRIPKAFAEEMCIAPNTAVELTLTNGSLVITPLQTPAFSLEDLLAAVTAQNIHEEIDSGTAVGNEVW
jgi:antitoxin MazE